MKNLVKISYQEEIPEVLDPSICVTIKDWIYVF